MVDQEGNMKQADQREDTTWEDDDDIKVGLGQQEAKKLRPE